MRLNSTPPGGLPEPQRHTHDQIADRAYRIYVENGCTDGHDLEHWFQAERSLTQEAAGPMAVQAPVPLLQQFSKPDASTMQLHEQKRARDERGPVSRRELAKRTLPIQAPRQSLRPAERSNRQRSQNGNEQNVKRSGVSSTSGVDR